MKTRPEFSTTVEPWEYDIDAQMEHFVKAANKEQAMFFSVDVGKLWGLYRSWKETREVLQEWLHEGRFMSDNSEEKSALVERTWKALRHE